VLAHFSADKPVMLSEAGADALAGRPGSAVTLFTVEHKEGHSRRERILPATPYVRGLCLQLLCDLPCERRQTSPAWDLKWITEDERTADLVQKGVSHDPSQISGSITQAMRLRTDGVQAMSKPGRTARPDKQARR
jgi:hypothetical protein